MAAPADTSMKRVTFELPIALDKRIKVFCAMNGVGKSETVAQVLHEYFMGRKRKTDLGPKDADVSEERT